MGYDTVFEGSFNLDRPLEPKLKAYLLRFSETRRHKRTFAKTEDLPDPLREAIGLPVGVDCEYYVGDTTEPGLHWGSNNIPPGEQPSLWCQWVPNDDGTKIVWDEGEKFYHYVEWLVYYIDHFLAPRNYILNGEVKWQGEEQNDTAIIRINNNSITIIVDCAQCPCCQERAREQKQREFMAAQ